MKKEEEIRKNLCELEYTKHLNYLVLILVIIATFIITSWFSLPNKRFNITSTALLTPLAFLIWFLINIRLRRIKKDLETI